MRARKKNKNRRENKVLQLKDVTAAHPATNPPSTEAAKTKNCNDSRVANKIRNAQISRRAQQYRAFELRQLNRGHDLP